MKHRFIIIRIIFLGVFFLLSIALQAQTFKASHLQRAYEKLHMNTSSTNRSDLTIRTSDDGTIEHIGIPLFNDEMRKLLPSPIYDYLEFALLDHKYHINENTLQQQKIRFFNGSWADLEKIRPSDRCTIDNRDDKWYIVKWERERLDYLAVVVPIDYELLANSTRKEMEQNFGRLLKQFKPKSDRCEGSVLLKASAGGGGKGIRIVRKEDEMEELLADCRYEAKTIYKNDQMLLEKYIENPRHIEIQIAADKYGNVVCLGERECSIQRCNQKVIEECPSTLVNDDMRQKMYASAVALAKECKYFSVGTFEFIADNDRNFYFLEMNTRLQVEHPVTECVIRAKGQPLDLVEVMIDIECGKKLSFTQKDITLVGNAIECRICAEQPSRNYLPSTGRIVHYIIPERSANVRVETGVQLGDEITPYYDSMFAKLITYGSTRNEAIETMKRALGQYEIGGIETNILLLESIIRQNCFAEGKLTTGFIKRHYPHGFNSLPLNEASKKAFIITSVVCFLREEMHCYDINQTRHLFHW